jgi:hypothetical protein
MPDSVDFDFSQLNTLVADLGKVPAAVIPDVRKAVEVSARNIKDDWRAAAKKANPKRARFYPKTIDYDMQLNTNGVIGAEIGPKLGGQGSLGFLEEGGGGVRSAPQRNVDKALRLNLADFEKGILKATGGIL